MAKLSALKIYHYFKNSNFPHHFLKLKISAIIKDRHLKFSLLVLIVNTEGRVSQIFYLGPSFYFMKC